MGNNKVSFKNKDKEVSGEGIPALILAASAAFVVVAGVIICIKKPDVALKCVELLTIH